MAKLDFKYTDIIQIGTRDVNNKTLKFNKNTIKKIHKKIYNVKFI